MNLLNPLASVAIGLIERGLLPESAIRAAIRRLVDARRRSLYRGSVEEQNARSLEFMNQAINESKLALDTDKANEQHYEVPAEFFDLVLGPHKKYSSCYFENDQTSLAEAEGAALAITCERAQIEDGMSVLELGCGWGSLTLWMAERYPNSDIVAVSNSSSQRQWIMRTARERGIAERLQVLTCDINELKLNQKFDRVVSVEMFEHVRNHRRLFANVSDWLADDGQMFVHIFCHRQFAYPFETQGAANWMGRHFFSGGMMPSRDLFRRYDEHLSVDREWSWNGTHYERTANAWAVNLDQNREQVLRLFRDIYGRGQELRWFMRWKVFFLACAELFGSHNGEEWFVEHYLFSHARKPSLSNH
jgi:cyclopropane-fatty-acyl-phospholipid synthase